MPTDRHVRNRLAALALGLACILTPTLANAQGGAGGGGRQQGGGGAGGQPGDRGGRGGGGGFGGGGFGRMMGGGDPMSPSVDSRELDKINKDLGLTAEQKDLAKGLFQGYEEQFKAKAQEWRDKLDKMREEARDSGDRTMFQNVGQQMNEFRQARQKMEDQFFSDYKAILTPEQQSRWPSVERDIRREKTIQRGMISGERMDVIKLVENAKLPADVMAKVQPLLDQYAADLDRELTNRNKVYDESMQKMLQVRGDPADSQDEMQKMIERGREASVRVRDVNRKYARQVEAALPDDQKPAWQKAVKEASFPDVYRQTNATRQITAAEGFGDLDTAQKESLKALKETYTRELDAANEKLAAAQEKNEMTFSADRMFRRGGGDTSDDPAAEARQQKRDLDQRTSDSLKKILTPEQADRLPAPQRAGGGPGGPGGGDNGGDRPRQRRNNGGNQDDAAPRRPNRAGGGG